MWYEPREAGSRVWAVKYSSILEYSWFPNCCQSVAVKVFSKRFSLHVLLWRDLEDLFIHLLDSQVSPLEKCFFIALTASEFLIFKQMFLKPRTWKGLAQSGHLVKSTRQNGSVSHSPFLPEAWCCFFNLLILLADHLCSRHRNSSLAPNPFPSLWSDYFSFDSLMPLFLMNPTSHPRISSVSQLHSHPRAFAHAIPCLEHSSHGSSVSSFRSQLKCHLHREAFLTPLFRGNKGTKKLSITAQ